MPDRPDQPQPPADGDEKLAGASVPVGLPARLKAEEHAGGAAELSEPTISADAHEQLKRALRRELNVPLQIKLQVLAGAAHSFEQRKYRHRRIMRTQRIAAAALFMVGTALAFKYMAPGKNQLPAPQGPIAMQTLGEASKAEALMADASNTVRAEKKLDEAAPSVALLKGPAEAPLASKNMRGRADIPASVPADLNTDGVVNILDAFALARTLEPLGGRVKAGNAALSKAGMGGADLNGDGFVDDLDVEFISSQAVSLSPLAMNTGGAR